MEPTNLNVDDGVEALNHQVDQVLSQVDKLEQSIIDIEKFYSKINKKQSSNSKGNLGLKDKEKNKHAASAKKQQDLAHMNTAAGKRMQELVCQFDTLLLQIIRHKWAGPFMEPVDVEGLGLDDYYQVIQKPMDIGTIRNKIEAKDGSGYKHVRDVYTDVMLVFENAMEYNDEKDEVHVMASTLLDKFKEKWRQFLPKVIEEEKRREAEEAETHMKEREAKEAAHAKMAQDVSDELYETHRHLEELRQTVLQKCRKMSIEEKRQLGTALTHLSTEDISKALQIIEESNPAFETAAEEVDLDIDALSESTLWKLMFFVKDALRAQGEPSRSAGCNNENNKENNNAADGTNNFKQKREMVDVFCKTDKYKKAAP